jgi:tetratricopeptide (TPR) repeat protein
MHRLLTIESNARSFTGGTHAAVTFDRAVDRLLRFKPEVVDLAGALTTDHPQAPMGQALAAYLSLMSTDLADLPAARHALAVLNTSPSLAPVERAHRDAIAAWVRGDWVGAARVLRDLLVQWPTDLLALAIGHQLDFFLADAAELRDRPARTLAALPADHPHAGLVLGMHAFGLEEAGHYEMAEAAGRAAVEANPDDVWGIHAVAHTLEMRGRVDEGIRFMESRRGDWGDDNLFAVHNWWHLALYYLEAGRHNDVLGLYDERIHHDRAGGVALELLDASALLMRLAIDGVDVGGRFGPLANAWEAVVDDESWYVFNDFHAVLAFAGAGRMDDARAVVRTLERVAAVRRGGVRTNVTMTADVGLPVARAAIAHFDGDHADVVSTLLPIRRIIARLGGSHAQRDLVARMLIHSTLAAGRHDLARALIDERLALRPTSTFGLDRRASLAATVGDAATADAARAAAAAHRARFASAITSSSV